MRRRRPERLCALAVALLGGALILPLAAGAAPGAAELVAERGCTACHGLVRKQVGPGFAQIAERYRGDPAAATRLAVRIRSGSVGNWGRVIMPAQANVTEPEAGALAAWVLSQPAKP